uniref:Uncharacterized protein n=1 Tax=Anguilla anguilla TaxID=7936 RepID=A0A0E9SXV8_ANGAN
MSPSISPYMY